MSRKSARDPRVQKTRRSLHEALIGLVREKDYHDIPVREILDRAKVGRSTFYMHFADKDELLASGIQRIAECSGHGDPLTSFSLPVLEHHEQHRRTGRMSRNARRLLHGRLRSAIAKRVRDDLIRSELRRRTRLRVPADLLAACVASTFVVVLDWWLDTRSALSPAEVNDLFCSLVTGVRSSAVETT